MRKLANLFTGRHGANALRLSPRTFIKLVSILLCSAESAPQQRLLYSFLAALRTWKDGEERLAALSNKKLVDVDNHVLVVHEENLTRDLTKTTLRFISSPSISDNAKRCAAQMLVVAISGHRDIEDLITVTDRDRLCQLAHNQNDYVLRVLVANVLRESLSSASNPKSLWPLDTLQSTIDNFPVAKETSSAWLMDVQDYFSETDKQSSFRELHHKVFRAKKYSYWKDDAADEGDHDVDDIMLILSEQTMSCMMYNEARAIDTICYPILDASSLRVQHVIDHNAPSTILTIEYSNDAGYRIMNGSKEVIRGLRFDFESVEQAEDAAKALSDLQHELEHDNVAQLTTDDVKIASSLDQRRRSIAIVDLSSSPRPQAKPLRDPNEVLQSDTYPLSPSPLHQKATQDLSQSYLKRVGNISEDMEASGNETHGQFKSFQDKIRPASPDSSDHHASNNAGKRQDLSTTRGLQNLPNIDTTVSNKAAKTRLRYIQGRNPSGKKGSESASSEESGHRPGQAKPSVKEKKIASNTSEPSGRKESSTRVKEISSATGQGSQTRSTVRVSTANSRQKADFPSSAAQDGAGTDESQLKRRKRPEHDDRNSINGIDWDEDMRGPQDFELSSDEEPQPKRSKLSSKDIDKKMASGKAKQVVSSQRFKKPFLPSKPSSRLPKKPANKKSKTTTNITQGDNPRTSQRNKKSQVYDEPEESGLGNSSDKENEPLRPQATVKKAGSRKAVNYKKAVTTTLDSYSAGGKAQTRNAEVLGSAQQPIEFSDDCASGIAQSPPPPAVSDASGPVGSAEPAPGTAVNVQVEAKSAEDSYPMTKADSDAALATADSDFTNSLIHMLNLPVEGSGSESEHSRHPTTPFGDKSKFVANVKASRSTKSKDESQERNSDAQKPSADMGNDEGMRPLHANIDDTAEDRKVITIAGLMTEVISPPLHTKRGVIEEIETAPQSFVQPGVNDQSEAATHEDAGINSDDASDGITHHASKPPSDQAIVDEEQPVMREPRPGDQNHVSDSEAKSATWESLDIEQSSSPSAHEGKVSIGSGAEERSKDHDARTIDGEVPKSPSATSERKVIDDHDADQDQSLRLQLKQTSTKLDVPVTAAPLTLGALEHHVNVVVVPGLSSKAARRTPVIHFDKDGPMSQGRLVSSGSRTARKGTLKTRYAAHPESAVARSSLLNVSEMPGRVGEDQTGPRRERELVSKSKAQQEHRHENVEQLRATAEANDAAATSDDPDSSADDLELDDRGDTEVLEGASHALRSQTEDQDDADGDQAVMHSSNDHLSGLADAPSGMTSEPDWQEADSQATSDPADASDSDDGHTGDEQQSQTPTHPAGATGRVNSEVLKAPVASRVSKLVSERTAEDSARESIGLREMIAKIHPQSQSAITTEAFRSKQGKHEVRKERAAALTAGALPATSLRVSSVNAQHYSENSKSTIEPVKTVANLPSLSQVGSRRIDMPPPPKRAKVIAPQNKGAAVTNSRSTMAAKHNVVGFRLDVGLGSKQIRATRARVTPPARSTIMFPESPQKPNRAPSGTPIPFHAVLEQEETKKTRNGVGTSPAETEAFVNDANDTTLVNGDADEADGQMGYRQPMFSARFGSTAPSEDFSSVAEEEQPVNELNAASPWTADVRTTHRDLFGLVMHMTRVRKALLSRCRLIKL